MTRRALGAIVVVEVRGRLERVAGEARASVLMALADEPPAVICDLSAVSGPYGAEAVDLLLSIGPEAREWPDSPVVLMCGSDGVSLAMGHRMAEAPLPLAVDLPSALALVSRAPRRTVARELLPPVARSVPRAREFVARTCWEWGWTSQTSAAALVTSELVTNALLHARTDLELTLTLCDGRLRLSVRDAHPQRPVVVHPPASRPTGRGMMLVAALSHAWGVLPTVTGGKVVWSVLPLGTAADAGRPLAPVRLASPSNPSPTEAVRSTEV